jgi:hypothetical protein
VAGPRELEATASIGRRNSRKFHLAKFKAPCLENPGRAFLFLLEDSLPGCLGRQASCLSVPWQAASEGKTDRLEACRPGQARHGTSPSDWRTGCLTSDAPQPAPHSSYRPQAGGYRDDLFVVATALPATSKPGEGGCAVQLFTPGPHSSDRPRAGGYRGKPTRAFLL